MTAEAQASAAVARGLEAHRTGRLDRAEAEYRAALASVPEHVEASHFLGLVFHGKGDRAAGLALVERTANESRNAQFHHNLGSLFESEGRLEEAVAAWRRALDLAPDRTVTVEVLARTLTIAGAFEDVVTLLRGFQARGVFTAGLANCLGVALHAQGKEDEAASAFGEALGLDPTDRHAAANQVGALLKGRRFDEAVAQAKVFQARFGADAAIAYALGQSLVTRARNEEARPYFVAGATADPRDLDCLMALLGLDAGLCRWDDRDATRAAILARLDSGKPIAHQPFVAMMCEFSEAELQRVMRSHAASVAVKTGPPLPARAARLGEERLRIGYLSGDLHGHPVSALMVEMLERHDRSRFQVTGYATGPKDGSRMQTRIRAAFEHLRDVEGVPAHKIAQMIRHDGIDILIDTSGYTTYGRPEILALRPAPVQAHLLGYPGTLGADFIDYLFVDPVTAPASSHQFYSEKLVVLPDCYQPNDGKRPRPGPAPSRRDLGLPERGALFCNFNNRNRLAPAMFDTWMRILAAAPDATLCLLDPEEEGARRRLLARAESRGVASARVRFMPRLGLPEHLARHRAMDLWLDSLPYNGHTSSSDALWAGLPVLTCMGDTFAGRVGASLLRAVGMPELIATSLADYEARAIAFARDPTPLAAARRKLDVARDSAPLFDSARYLRHLETALTAMWRRYRGG